MQTHNNETPPRETFPAISCRECNSAMEKTVKDDSSCAGILMCLLGFVLILTISIWSFLGLVLIAFGFRLGFKKTKIWRCKSCGYFYERTGTTETKSETKSNKTPKWLERELQQTKKDSESDVR